MQVKLASKIGIQNKANNEATMNQKAKVNFFLTETNLWPSYDLWPSAGKKRTSCTHEDSSIFSLYFYEGRAQIKESKEHCLCIKENQNKSSQSLLCNPSTLKSPLAHVCLQFSLSTWFSCKLPDILFFLSKCTVIKIFPFWTSDHGLFLRFYHNLCLMHYRLLARVLLIGYVPSNGVTVRRIVPGYQETSGIIGKSLAERLLPPIWFSQISGGSTLTTLSRHVFFL